MCQKLSKAVALATLVTFILVLLQYQNRSSQQRYNINSHPKSNSQNTSSLKYLISNFVCSGGIQEIGEEIRLIMIITSHPGDTHLRKKLRQMLPTQNLRKIGMRRLFLLGRLQSSPPPKGESKYNWVSFAEIQEESQKNEDILMGDFLESYHNLTTKHLMGLQWVATFCPQAQLLIKQDDDIIVDYYQLDHLLSEPPFSTVPTGRYILGKVLDYQPVIRDPKSKWFVTRDEYGLSDTFPPFVSGWAYITTPKVAGLLVKASRKMKYFWIDDAHITGTLREAVGVQLIDLAEYFTTFKGQLQCCVATPKSNHPAITRSHVSQPYWCDYVVGPPNDDLVLMELFHAHANFCHTRQICERRQGKEKLEHRCVITPRMIVNKFTAPFGNENDITSNNSNVKNNARWKSLGTVNIIS